MTIDRKILEILVCPKTHTTLEYDAAHQELISRTAGLAYPSTRRHSGYAGRRSTGD